jgi:hypothetical protein
VNDTNSIDPADVAAEAGSLAAGYGIVTVQLFPFALPLLILCIVPCCRWSLSACSWAPSSTCR